jgi:hypothetical protein
MRDIDFAVEKVEPTAISVRHKPTHGRFSFMIEKRKLSWAVSQEPNPRDPALRGVALAFATNVARRRGLID